MRKPRAADFAIFGLAAGVSGAFMLDLCDWIFACGCRSPWAGAAESCNIHTAAARHCPWCVMSPVWLAVIFGCMLGLQAVITLAQEWRWPVRLVLALGAFPAVGWLAGLLSGMYLRYWN